MTHNNIFMKLIGDSIGIWIGIKFDYIFTIQFDEFFWTVKKFKKKPFLDIFFREFFYIPMTHNTDF